MRSLFAVRNKEKRPGNCPAAFSVVSIGQAFRGIILFLTT